MHDLDEIALGLPEATKELGDGRPTYRVHGRCSASTAGLGRTPSIRTPAARDM
jgi:hypothetical protein